MTSDSKAAKPERESVCVRVRVFLRGIQTRTQTKTEGGKIGTEHSEGRSREGGAEERWGG